MRAYQPVALIAVLLVLVALVSSKIKIPREQPKDDGPETVVADAGAASEPAATASGSQPMESKPTPVGPVSASGADKQLPTLLELGSVGCQSCAYMTPIIEALEKELAGKVVVRFHDLAKQPELAERYQVMTIPTQIFLDANGKEIFRHIGIYEKSEILAKMKELGMLKDKD